MNCGLAWDNDTARSPQTGGPLPRISRDLGVTRKLSNLHLDKPYKSVVTTFMHGTILIWQNGKKEHQNPISYRASRGEMFIKWSSACHKKPNLYRQKEDHLDVIWYNISDRSSFCSKFCCIVAKPIRRGSRSPTRQLFISNPFFCLGFISVGFASNNRSFKAPTKTARMKFILLVKRIMVKHKLQKMNACYTPQIETQSRAATWVGWSDRWLTWSQPELRKNQPKL